MRCQKQRIFYSANMFGLTKCMRPLVPRVLWLGGCRGLMRKHPKCSCECGQVRKTRMCCVPTWRCCVALTTQRWRWCAWRLPVAMDATAQTMWPPMQRCCPKQLERRFVCNFQESKNTHGNPKGPHNSCKCAVAYRPMANQLATTFKPLTRPMVHPPWPCC